MASPLVATPAYVVAFEPELTDDPVDWAAQLRPWLDVFSSGSAAFGLVEDWRSDGSSFTRHGVIVELRVSVDKVLSHGEGAVAEKIREAVDLVLLILAVKPSEIKLVLMRKARPSKFEEELAAMARGVPIELRLQF